MKQKIILSIIFAFLFSFYFLNSVSQIPSESQSVINYADDFSGRYLDGFATGGSDISFNHANDSYFSLTKLVEENFKSSGSDLFATFESNNYANESLDVLYLKLKYIISENKLSEQFVNTTVIPFGVISSISPVWVFWIVLYIVTLLAARWYLRLTSGVSPPNLIRTPFKFYTF